jgi:hypothetical protein
MVLPPATRSRIPLPLLVVSAFVAVGLIAGGIYLARTPANRQQRPEASPEAKTYVRNLRLSDISMKATENFMKQQVVEIDGKIANNGPRPLQSVEIYCLFSGVDGREIYRERVPIVQTKGSPLKPGEIRNFRLPFDRPPDTWNQALPRMAIAQITFAR